jgi:hypothetical protein
MPAGKKGIKTAKNMRALFMAVVSLLRWELKVNQTQQNSYENRLKQPVGYD